jgi:hypothetical protein
MSTKNYCLPPPVWENLGAATVKGSNPELDGATLVLVAQPYRDELLADRFQLEIPTNARILGIEVILRRAADFPESAADNGIRLIKAGIVGGADRSRSEQWGTGSFQEVTYGGSTDLWGQDWTVADLIAPEFGLAMSVKYTQSAGNARSYVDLVTVRVHYGVDCN